MAVALLPGAAEAARRHFSPRDKLIVDLFAGGGGMSEAFKMSIGRDPDVAINHNDDALSMHRANHPRTRHLVADVFEVCPRAATQGKPVWWLHLSPDCFPAGTMVLARSGYKAIETLEIGEEVLTHRGRWRKVTATMSAIRPLMKIRGKGHPGLLVSPEHPFFVRPAKRNSRGDLLDLQEPIWQKAGEVSKDSYWGSPTAFPSIPIPPIVASRGRTFTIDERLLWLVGRYVADGWTRLTETRAELVITCGTHEVDDLRARLDAWVRSGYRASSDELAWHDRTTATAYQFTTNSRGLVGWLRDQFGHGAAKKLIPGWLLGATESLRRAFLDGYVSGDGCRPKTKGSSVVMCTTVSPALAYGLKSLALSLGYSPNIYISEYQPHDIEGRMVTGRPAFSVRWREPPVRQHAHVIDGIEWAPVRQVASLGVTTQVFNISVEDDESYVVEGVIVHNCTHHSQARGGQPRDEKIRALSWVGVRWAGQTLPDVISLENVPQILKWGPLIAKRDPKTGRVVTLDMVVDPKTGREVHRIAEPGERVPRDRQFLIPNPKREGETWKHFVRTFERMGYTVEIDVSVAADLGGHTIRKRVFMIARRDGQPIIMPQREYASKRDLQRNRARGLKPHKTAADVIDFSIPCPSIFARKKPLAPATLRRVARGLDQFVLDNPDPFIVPIVQRRRHGAVAPTLLPATHQGSDRIHDPLDAMPTVTGASRGELMLSAPVLAKLPGESPCAAFLAQMNAGYNVIDGHPLSEPMSTIASRGSQQQLVAAHLATLRHHSTGHGLDEALPTLSAGGEHHAVVESTVQPVWPVGMEQPATASGLCPEDEAGALRVSAFLMRYYGEGGQWSACDDAMATMTTKDRVALVTVTYRGTPHVIVDIGLRMLEPRELFRAQDFPDSYIINRGHDGRKFSKSKQVRMVGNSVDPVQGAAYIRANAHEVANFAIDRMVA